jgi:hypothetical protein
MPLDLDKRSINGATNIRETAHRFKARHNVPPSSFVFWHFDCASKIASPQYFDHFSDIEESTRLATRNIKRSKRMPYSKDSSRHLVSITVAKIMEAYSDPISNSNAEHCAHPSTYFQSS